MILIYWKGKVGQGISKLLSYLQIPFDIKDDSDKISNLEKYNYIIPSPWIKPNHKIYSHKSKILGELDLIHFLLTKNFKFTSYKGYYKNQEKIIYFIGITWTDWKSTTTWKIYNILNKLKPSQVKIWIGGNFDIPLSELILNFLENPSKTNIFVLEISSFMAYNLKHLQFLGSMWTNFAVDHLDWHENLQDYFQSKQKLLKQSKIYFPKFVISTKKPVFFKTRKLTYFLKKIFLQLWRNFPKNLYYHFKKIPPLPHRLQYIWNLWKTKVIDDGKCTTKNCLEYALNKLNWKIILISWWFDKGITYEWLEILIKKKVIYGILFGDIKTKLEKVFKKSKVKYKSFNNFDQAILHSIKISKILQPDYLLFSPWASSFDMFANRKERVNKFLELINKNLILKK